MPRLTIRVWPDGSSVRPEAHAGVVFANDAGYLDTCGHGSIGVATTLVAQGVVPATEPFTEILLDTPAGSVECRVAVAGGRPRSVRIRNVPSFLSESGIRTEVPGVGAVTVDVAYGGNWFAFVPAEQVGLEVAMDQLEPLMRTAKLAWSGMSSIVVLTAGS